MIKIACPLAFVLLVATTLCSLVEVSTIWTSLSANTFPFLLRIVAVKVNPFLQFLLSYCYKMKPLPLQFYLKKDKQNETVLGIPLQFLSIDIVFIESTFNDFVSKADLSVLIR